ncbi:MAG: hypothetical protein AAB874_04475 [Patescibacteria group bacterium]
MSIEIQVIHSADQKYSQSAHTPIPNLPELKTGMPGASPIDLLFAHITAHITAAKPAETQSSQILETLKSRAVETPMPIWAGEGMRFRPAMQIDMVRAPVVESRTRTSARISLALGAAYGGVKAMDDHPKSRRRLPGSAKFDALDLAKLGAGTLGFDPEPARKISLVEAAINANLDRLMIEHLKLLAKEPAFNESEIARSLLFLRGIVESKKEYTLRSSKADKRLSAIDPNQISSALVSEKGKTASDTIYTLYSQDGSVLGEFSHQDAMHLLVQALLVAASPGDRPDGINVKNLTILHEKFTEVGLYFANSRDYFTAPQRDAKKASLGLQPYWFAGELKVVTGASGEQKLEVEQVNCPATSDGTDAFLQMNFKPILVQWRSQAKPQPQLQRINEISQDAFQPKRGLVYPGVLYSDLPARYKSRDNSKPNTIYYGNIPVNMFFGILNYHSDRVNKHISKRKLKKSFAVFASKHEQKHKRQIQFQEIFRFAYRKVDPKRRQGSQKDHGIDLTMISGKQKRNLNLFNDIARSNSSRLAAVRLSSPRLPLSSPRLQLSSPRLQLSSPRRRGSRVGFPIGTGMTHDAPQLAAGSSFQHPVLGRLNVAKVENVLPVVFKNREKLPGVSARDPIINEQTITKTSSLQPFPESKTVKVTPRKFPGRERMDVAGFKRLAQTQSEKSAYHVGQRLKQAMNFMFAGKTEAKAALTGHTPQRIQAIHTDGLNIGNKVSHVAVGAKRVDFSTPVVISANSGQADEDLLALENSIGRQSETGTYETRGTHVKSSATRNAFGNQSLAHMDPRHLTKQVRSRRYLSNGHVVSAVALNSADTRYLPSDHISAAHFFRNYLVAKGR